MSVSRRNMYVIGAAASAFAILGVEAFADGPIFPSGPTIVVPGVSAPSNAGGSGCCAHGSINVAVPGVTIAGPNVAVGGGSNFVGGGIVETQTSLNVPLLTQTERQQTFLGGGSSYFAPEISPPSVVTLSGREESNTETVVEEVPVLEEYCADQIVETSSIRPVQAVCIDDKGTPHPASRLSKSKSVSANDEGELFRCLAGTRMQVTMGEMNGQQASFARAETFTCQKGEALSYTLRGELNCTAQKPQRNCNERSLLRRNGPGIKLVQTRVRSKVCVPQTRTVYQTQSREVQRIREAAPQRIILNGGVGNGIY